MIIIHFEQVHDNILINQCDTCPKTGFFMLIMLIKIN